MMKELFTNKGIECQSCNSHAQDAEELIFRLKIVTKVRRDIESERKRPAYP
jgi:hypothetical protein